MTLIKQYVENRKGRQEKPELMINGYLWANFETLLTYKGTGMVEDVSLKESQFS